MNGLIRNRRLLGGLSGVLLLVFAAWPARAEGPTVVVVTLHDHRFSPAELRVPAGVPIVLEIRNEDATAEEFESGALKIEKVVAGRSTAKVRIRALAKGSYRFVGEFHEDTAKGVLVAE